MAKKIVKPIKSAEQAWQEHLQLKSTICEETLLSQRIMIYIVELLEKQAKKKRKPTAYQQHVGKVLKAGGTLQEAGKTWKSKK